MEAVDRRRLLLGAGAVVLLSGCSKGKSAQAEEVTPPEDLMREHGVLNRILLVYEEGTRRLASPGDPPFDAIAGGAEIIRRFIQDYHEKNEENFLFPRFEKANKLVQLVATLRRQHQAGRVLTETIQSLANPATANDPGARHRLSEAMTLFVRMYRPHEAREDTVLFPALRTVTTKHEFEEIGERFEETEHQLFGDKGFDGIVERVVELERAVGIDDLNRFTPPAV